MPSHLWSASALVALSLVAPAAARAQLEALDAALVVELPERRTEMIAQLRSWVGMNTGSWNRAGLERFAEQLAAPLRGLGFRVEVLPGPELDYPGRGRVRTGPIVVARRAAPPDGARFLLVGHYDTVFEPDSPFQSLRLDPNDPGRALGPGAADMKGGLVVMFHALRALAEAGDLERAGWTVLLNGDEEIGSLGSRAWIEAEARAASFGLVFESARRGGEMVRSRRGLGQFYLTAKGVAAHSGSAHEDGRSAVLEMAHKVIEIEKLTDYTAGVTVNAGIFSGGSKRNIVPDHAEVWVDLRYDTREQGEHARARLREIAASNRVPGVTSTFWGSLHRPPKPETPETARLLEMHAGIARALRLVPPAAVHAGGGTDGSLMAAVGLPTLDSMGVRGGRAHTEREFVVLDSLVERAALAALLLRGLLYAPPGGR